MWFGNRNIWFTEVLLNHEAKSIWATKWIFISHPAHSQVVINSFSSGDHVCSRYGTERGKKKGGANRNDIAILLVCRLAEEGKNTPPSSVLCLCLPKKWGRGKKKLLSLCLQQRKVFFYPLDLSVRNYSGSPLPPGSALCALNIELSSLVTCLLENIN